MPISHDEAGCLVERVRAGDGAAWEQLVEAYVGLVWAIARNHRLGSSDAADVSQTTWLRLIENIDGIEDPKRVGAWLATTARRECLRVIRLAKRELPVLDESDLQRGDPNEVPVDAAMLRTEQSEATRAAFVQLPDRCQQLLRLMMLDEPPRYDALSAALSMPIGSIGPTRGRCLNKLKILLEQAQGPSQ